MDRTNKILQTNCGFEDIPFFTSRAEFKRFTKFLDKKIENGIAVEVPHDLKYQAGQLSGGRWFECVENKTIWRLLEPDFPFRGCWEVVSDYQFCNVKVSIKISDIGVLSKFKWAHMWYAMKIGLLSRTVFVDKAVWDIQNDLDNDNIVKLAGLYPDSEKEEIEDLVYQLACIGADLGLSKIKDDWAILLCCSLLEDDPSFEELLPKIDDLWSSLGCPDVLTQFLSFQPPPINQDEDIKTRLKKLCTKTGYC